MRPTIGLPFALAALAVVAPGAAAAQDVGAPVPCGPVPILDASGDQEVGLIVDPAHAVPRQKGPDNLDITHAFLNTTMGAGGKWRSTVNIGITNLTKAIPPESVTGVVSYTFEFKRHNQDIIYVRARTDGHEVTYHYIYGDRIETPQFTTELTWGGFRTTGRFIEGPQGMVEIVLPEAIAAPGTRFEDVFVMVSQREAGWAPYADVGYRFDSAPDDEARAHLSLKLEACPTMPAAAPTATPAAAPTVRRRSKQPVKVANPRKSTPRRAAKHPRRKSRRAARCRRARHARPAVKKRLCRGVARRKATRRINRV